LHHQLAPQFSLGEVLLCQLLWEPLRIQAEATVEEKVEEQCRGEKVLMGLVRTAKGGRRLHLFRLQIPGLVVEQQK